MVIISYLFMIIFSSFQFYKIGASVRVDRLRTGPFISREKKLHSEVSQPTLESRKSFAVG